MNNQSVVFKSPYFMFVCKCCNSSFFCNKLSLSAIPFFLCSRLRSCLLKGVFGRRDLFKILISTLLWKWHPTVYPPCPSVCLYVSCIHTTVGITHNSGKSLVSLGLKGQWSRSQVRVVYLPTNSFPDDNLISFI